MTMKPHPALLPFSWLYGAGVAARNLLFDIGLFPAASLSVPVISVGNISAGGTGKTPFVEFLAGELLARGKKAGIVSRGYGRESKGYQVVSNGRQRCAAAITAGDEPALLADHLDGVPIVVDEDRVRGAERIVETFGVDVVLLDDGFQHRSLGRNADIVLVAAHELNGGSHLLPAGYRREPWRSLKRATLVVITKCDNKQSFESARAQLEPQVSVPMVGTRTKVTGAYRFGSGQSPDASMLGGQPVLAFSGIGDPRAFERTLAGLNARVQAYRRFRDHHWFTNEDLGQLEAARIKSGAAMLATTEKDAVRFDRLPDQTRQMLKELPLVIVRVQPEIIAGDDAIAAMFHAVLK